LHYLIGVFLSCKQISEKRTGQIVQTEADQSYSLQNNPLVLQSRPAQGDSLMTNPPGFHWSQENGDAGLPLPLHMPSFVLEKGNWFWRWRSVEKNGEVSTPSAPIQFTISEESIEYIVPPLKELFTRIPQKHPRLFVLIVGLNLNSYAQYEFPFQNPKLPLEERVNDLVSRLTVQEKIDQLLYEAPAIDRLEIPEYNWWNECLHGVGRAGYATVFPQSIFFVIGKNKICHKNIKFH